MGTLTSQPFMILGNFISFLIGGGCDPLTEYVELLVDGYLVARSTGKCAETMRREVGGRGTGGHSSLDAVSLVLTGAFLFIACF